MTQQKRRFEWLDTECVSSKAWTRLTVSLRQRAAVHARLPGSAERVVYPDLSAVPGHPGRRTLCRCACGLGESSTHFHSTSSSTCWNCVSPNWPRSSTFFSYWSPTTPRTGPRLLERLCNGTYPNVIQKVVYVLLDCFPSEAYRDGWVADALVRNYLGTHGLRRVGGLQPDDLLVLNDADELSRRELISFLKWHDGFSEPVTITYRWSVFGFFWGVPASDGAMQTQQLPSVITVGMVIYVFRYRIYEIRSAARFLSQRQQAFDGQVPVVAFCTDFS